MGLEGTDLAATGSTPAGCETVALAVAREQLRVFFPLLQRGVEVLAEVGRPLKELLCGQFGIDEEYVTGRITTIFLDNHPVDDLDRSLVHEGSRVTLSAAMPGLVGATMRRSGFYAAFRQGISHAEGGGDIKAGQGMVKLKLFNLLLPELGPLVLGRGVYLHPGQLDLLRHRLQESSNDIAATPACVGDDPRRVLLKVTWTD